MSNKKTIFIMFLILVLGFFAFGKTTKANELRFQLGFGGFISTSNLLGLIENAKMIDAIQKQQDQKLIGLTDSQNKDFSNISRAMQTSMIVANIIGGMEYGLKMRILWHILISDIDFALLPFDGSYNGRLDMLLNFNAGIRAPFFLMPFVMIGFTSVFSFYAPEDYTNPDSWKDRAWGAYKNFIFRPGLNITAGFGLKFKGFSVEGYYKFTIKDFEEFRGFYNQLVDTLQRSPADAVGGILAYQSRFGVSLVWYLF
ncbi:MAG: hypothetical protein A2Y34_15320 [Spirochaetes bacterium GWC1_27_15]|nr:MAG: hypothetical protein A2Z98_01020 [Spirochaetes bacterium GWB1_27_13]OHD25869.1 MAG: hypothetical protein A2Y34_15320 [Spirochaetes bacterium GWC1_27_15]